MRVNKHSRRGNEVSKQGAVLIIVLMMMTLLTLMVVAMFVTARSEMLSAEAYVSTVQSDQLAEIAKSAVISQIKRGTRFDPKDEIIWASQPGALRSYSSDGAFYRGFKLYSDSEMEVHENERDLATDAPPADWNEFPDHYVDLNAPVVRSGSDGQPHTYFPVFDPRAGFDDPGTKANERVEGFSYQKENKANGDIIFGIDDDIENPAKRRLPMPVEWLYVLQDGTVGILDEENNFQPSEKATEQNPIVGRIAFWTDDETSKININTASEPTYWATPTLGDRDDWGWAKIQPGSGEFQRFPGHPATTALSPVLFPNQTFVDAVAPSENGKMPQAELRIARASAAEKGRIYEWAPKVQNIGSKSGTEFLTYSSQRTRIGWKKNYSYKDAYDPFVAARERLYASVDEYLLGTERDERNFTFTGFSDTNDLARRKMKRDGKLRRNAEDTIRRSRAFLTAHSRAPETTLFGTPRIAMWPLHANASEAAGYRSHYDRLIARCATLGDVNTGGTGDDNSYYFRRKDSSHSMTDIEIQRNQKLLDYLDRLTSRKVPGYGGTFSEKYKEDHHQILVEMFDYIRMTNTFDPVLAGEGVENNGDYKTFTPGRKTGVRRGQTEIDFRDGPDHFTNGHGHIVPSYSAKWEAKGLGRTVTINEAAMLLICCADGTPNQFNKYRKDPDIEDPWKGGAAAQVKGAKRNNGKGGEDRPTSNEFAMERTTTVAYSNFPPRPVGEPYGPRKDDEGNIAHPGYKRVNWNFALDENKPLNPGKKRIQGMMLFDFFNPAPGFNPIRTRIGLRIKGLSNFVIDGKPLFPMDETTVWRTGGSAAAHWSVGSGMVNKWKNGRRWITTGNRVEGRAPMPQDSFGPPQTNKLVSNFIDVDEESMSFGATGPLEVELVAQQHAGGNVELLQTIVIRFPPPQTIPSPNLVLDGRPGRRVIYDPEDHGEMPPGWIETDPITGEKVDGTYESYTDFHPQAPYFWSFYSKGYNTSSSGRMRSPHGKRGVWWAPYEGDYINPHRQRDVIFSMAPWHGDYRITSASQWVEEDEESPYEGYVFAPLPGAPYYDASNSHFGSHMLEHSMTSGKQRVKVRVNGKLKWIWRMRNPNNALGHGWQFKSDSIFSGFLFSQHSLAGLPWMKDGSSITPHFPLHEKASQLSRRYGDFDIGYGSHQGGPFINKPDEGTLHSAEKGQSQGQVTNLGQFKKTPYFNSNWGEETQDGFFSPNRMISSPAMMGSLPSGVKAQDPWRTLLFRPDVNAIDPSGQPAVHPGAKNPPDHLLLDLFWMPVVEPYAISEPFSTAGKVNLNYQILPFTYIRRATGLHGVLKHEKITALPIFPADPSKDANFARILNWNPSRAYNVKDIKNQWREKFLYRSIDVNETLEDFDAKFEKECTLFRTASQICEMHLVPNTVSMPPKVKFNEGRFPNKKLDNEERMKDFWKTHRGTSDNLKERPYANIYSRLTTQTNTWRIHYRVQRLKKSKGSEPGKFESDQLDTVSGEQRGSVLVERYIDPNDPNLPDFTKQTGESLDTKYLFRVLSTRRFAM
ncbi:MAG: Verru_Chthon cassette protein A [Verrucomicrobiales bacterium]|nr:Verru_Chthon cassette protein A [Verrucomicrobiales bacterium]